MKILSQQFKDTLWIRYFGLRTIPMIFFVKPSVIELNGHKCIIKIPFKRRTRNHLGSMYFGALSVGADLAAGIIAMRIISKSNKNISLIFKDFSAEFLSRIESDAFFICEDGNKISQALKKTIATKERVNLAVKIHVKSAIFPENDVLANFTLTLSLKDRS
jgi:acyl-coenzyme A thioesterase PaaI-like protein